MDALFAHAEATFGTVTLLVNSAWLNMTGVNPVDLELAQFERVVRSDLTDLFLTYRRMVRALEGKGMKARIVNISSIHERAPRPGGVDYDSAKGGLSQLTATLALELAPKGIAVNGVAPGMILTPMNQSALDNPAELKTREAAIPLGPRRQARGGGGAGRLPALAGGGLHHRHDGDDRRRAVAHRRAGRLTMATYAVEQIDVVTISDGSPLAGMDLMSPFVWKEGDTWRIMIRGVPDPLGPADPTGVIATGTSRDGLVFAIDPELAITPDSFATADDAGGREDPTVLVTGDGEYLVFYTGVDAARSQGCMLLAKGRQLTDLAANRVILKAPPGEGNIKEATLAQAAAGD